MDITFIIAVVISTIVSLGILILVVMLIYYNWRNHELLANFCAFVRDNLQLKEEIVKLKNENDALSEELKQQREQHVKKQNKVKTKI